MLSSLEKKYITYAHYWFHPSDWENSPVQLVQGCDIQEHLSIHCPSSLIEFAVVFLPHHGRGKWVPPTLVSFHLG